MAIASPTDFMETVSVSSAPRNFSKVNLGYLHHAVIDGRLEGGGGLLRDSFGISSSV